MAPRSGGAGFVVPAGATRPTSAGFSPSLTPRGPTARSRLSIHWHHPTYTPEVTEDETAVLGALERKDAYDYVSDGDLRPLLVLRECLTCRGTDLALMRRQEDNEKTILLSRWFRCVKLPPDVTEKDHPFHSLFEQEEPPHLFLARHDGSEYTPLSGRASRAELWKHMLGMLKTEYKKNPERPISMLFKVLDKYDLVDSKIELLEDRRDGLIERYGLKSTKLARVERDLEKAKAERNALAMREREISELDLKQQPAAAGAGE